MRVLVTAGGTSEPIDDVRVLTNTSTGRLGACLAEAFARAGHQVTLLHARAAALPAAPEVALVPFGSHADLAQALEAHVPGCDVVLHAAAVSDYVPERSAGKLSSDQDELVLRLRRAPKLIDRLRDLAPEALLVGFKLTSGRSEDERLTIARELLRRARLDLVVANEAAHTGPEDHAVLVVGADDHQAGGGGKAAVAQLLRERVERARSPVG